MLLWLSRQSTSLVRMRSPVRIRLAAPTKKPLLSTKRGFFVVFVSAGRNIVRRHAPTSFCGLPQTSL